MTRRTAESRRLAALAIAAAGALGCREPLPGGPTFDGGGEVDAKATDDARVDAGTPLPDAGTCTTTIDDLLDDPSGDDLELALAAGDDAFELVAIERRPTADPSRNVYFVRVPEVGSPDDERRALAPGEETIVAHPAIVWTGTRYVAAWSEGFGGALELATTTLDASGAFERGVERVTATDVAERHVVLARHGTAAIAAYVAESADLPFTWQASFQALDDDGRAAGDVVPLGDANGLGVPLVLAPRGAAYSLAYASTNGALLIAPLSEAGVLGTSRTASGALPIESTFDVAFGAHGGLATYSVLLGGSRHVVRHRVLEADGAPVGDENDTLGPGARGADPAVASLENGFVVAYRGGPAGEAPALRVALVDVNGNVVRDAPIVEVSSLEGLVRVAATPSGRAYVVFSDTSSSGGGVRIRGVHLDCE